MTEKLKEWFQACKKAITTGIVTVTICFSMFGSVYYIGRQTENINQRIQDNTDDIEINKQSIKNLKEKIDINKNLLIEFREFRAEQQQGMKDLSDRLDNIEKRLNFSHPAMKRGG